jgi:2-polyprenyl-3-methyl-5-hydroxy-6-metoxy-1,4-benzoquinol methylase
MASLKSRLPKPVRRRLGRYKRILFRQPLSQPRSVPKVAPQPPQAVAARSAPEAVRQSAAQAAAGTVAAPPKKSRLQVRRDAVFATADPAGSVLEIGPAHNGILPKRDGFRTKTVDYLDRAGLVEKYREFTQYSADDIEEVDYVLPPGASMADVIEERFDLVLASHVLEHTTSLIHFLNECTKLLADGGVLALVVPDHRYCFDRFRERSALSRIIDAWVDPPSVHTVGTLTEFALNAVKHRGTTSWAPGHAGTYSLIHDLEQVKAKTAEAKSGSYVDVHNWIFTPHHLRLMLQDLYDVDLISLREAYFHDTVGHEFFINLTIDGSGTGLSRGKLLVLADEELRTMDLPVFGDH